MIIDIEYLHKTIELEPMWRLMPRQSGRTFAMMVQAAQSADLLREEYSTIVMLVERPLPMTALRQGVEDVAKSLGIDYVRLGTDQLTFGHCRMRFICRISMMDKLRGLKFNNVFIDHYTKSLNENEINFIETRLI